MGIIAMFMFFSVVILVLAGTYLQLGRYLLCAVLTFIGGLFVLTVGVLAITHETGGTLWGLL